MPQSMQKSVHIHNILCKSSKNEENSNVCELTNKAWYAHTMEDTC